MGKILIGLSGFLRKRPFTVFVAVICMSSLLSTGWVICTVTPVSDVRSYYENVAEYHFMPLSAEEGISVEQNSNMARISWENLVDKFYVTSFDGGVGSMPGEAFSKLAAIPDGTKKVQVDLSLRGQYNLDPQKDVQTILYLAAYDENGQTVIESIAPEYSNPRERPRNFTISLKVDHRSKFYKILLRISPSYEQSESGFVEISKLDVMFQ